MRTEDETLGMFQACRKTHTAPLCHVPFMLALPSMTSVCAISENIQLGVEAIDTITL